jgi:hypothetical protein
MSAAQKGRPGRIPGPETRAKMSAAGKGRTFSPEHRAKLSAALKGRTLSPEARAKLSAAGKGRKVSPETRAKLSAAGKGRTLSPEARAKMSAAQKGRTHSPEHRAKNSAAKKGRRFIPGELADQFEAFRKHQAEGSTRIPTTRPKSATSTDPKRKPAVELGAPGEPAKVMNKRKKSPTEAQRRAIEALLAVWPKGLAMKELDAACGDKKGWRTTLRRLKESDGDWDSAIIFPSEGSFGEHAQLYRIGFAPDK